MLLFPAEGFFLFPFRGDGLCRNCSLVDGDLCLLERHGKPQMGLCFRDFAGFCATYQNQCLADLPPASFLLDPQPFRAMESHLPGKGSNDRPRWDSPIFQSHSTNRDSTDYIRSSVAMALEGYAPKNLPLSGFSSASPICLYILFGNSSFPGPMALSLGFNFHYSSAGYPDPLFYRMDPHHRSSQQNECFSIIQCFIPSSFNFASLCPQI